MVSPPRMTEDLSPLNANHSDFLLNISGLNQTTLARQMSDSAQQRTYHRLTQTILIFY